MRSDKRKGIISQVEQFCNADYCPNCGATNAKKNDDNTNSKDTSKGVLITDHERGEILCAYCGFVLRHNISTVSEKHTTASSLEEYQTNARVGQPTSLARSDMGLYTVMGKDKDATGNQITGNTKHTMSRLRKLDKISVQVSTKQRNMTKAFNLLESLKTKLCLPQAVVERTAYMYRKALDHDMIRGRTISALLGACIYAVCRDISSPRTLQEIHKSLGITRRSLTKTYRALHWRLGLKVTITDAKDCVYRITTRAGLREKTARVAISIVEKADKKGLCYGKDPVATAATAVYIAANTEGENKTMKEISKLCGTAGLTIRVRSKEIAKALNMEL